MDRKSPFSVGEFYHLYNRGVEKRSIFQDARDWNKFRDNLYMYNAAGSLKSRDMPADIFSFPKQENLVDVLAYALMPNHFHLIVRERQEKGISSFMAKVLTSYSMYFNVKYERNGPLMCRPFRSSHIGSDEYFRWVFAYVHLNPLLTLDAGWKELGIHDRCQAVEYLQTYAHSSYPDYFGKTRKESAILAKDALPADVSDIVAGDDLFAVVQEGRGAGVFSAVDAFVS